MPGNYVKRGGAHHSSAEAITAVSHSLGTSTGTGKGPVWQTSTQQVGGTAETYSRELHFGHRATRKRFPREGVKDTLLKRPHNETWAPSGAGTAEEAEILHVDVRSVSLGMGKGGFLWASRSTTSTKSQNWGVGLHGEDLSLPCQEDSGNTEAPPCLLHCETPVRLSSTSRCHLPLPWGQFSVWAQPQELQTS